jgi:argininosuccinate synthase
MSDVKKVVLAYSGGLDTSVILKWLQDTYQCEVVTFTADLGQGEELEPARAKALQFGIKPENIFIDDLREEFVRDFVFPMFRCNTVYEGEYLLGTSIARPLIAKRLIDIVNATGADAISHGATGKGNDQVRFELGAYALKPGIKVIAPWREWDLLSPICCTFPMKGVIWKTRLPKLKSRCGGGLFLRKRHRIRLNTSILNMRKVTLLP